MIAAVAVAAPAMGEIERVEILYHEPESRREALTMPAGWYVRAWRAGRTAPSVIEGPYPNAWEAAQVASMRVTPAPRPDPKMRHG